MPLAHELFFTFLFFKEGIVLIREIPCFSNICRIALSEESPLMFSIGRLLRSLRMEFQLLFSRHLARCIFLINAGGT